MRITGGSEDLEDAIVDGEERYIESSTTKIVDNDLRLATFLVETISDGGGGRFVNDAENLETGNSASIFSGLTLCIIEV